MKDETDVPQESALLHVHTSHATLDAAAWRFAAQPAAHTLPEPLQPYISGERRFSSDLSSLQEEKSHSRYPLRVLGGWDLKGFGF